MRKFVAAGLTVLCAFVTVPTAHAAPGELIEDFTVRINVTQAGLLHVTETVIYNFGTNEHHGIRRDIPLRDYLSHDEIQQYSVQIKKVSQDGHDAQFTRQESEDYLSLKVGNPDVNVSGTHKYRFEYVVVNALKRVSEKTSTLNPGDVDLYWDVIGSAWEVPIIHASARILFPGTPKQMNCTYGSPGSITPCPIKSAGTTVQLYSPTRLNAFEPMTVAIQVDPAYFSGLGRPLITAAPAGAETNINQVKLISAGIGALIACILIIIAITRRRREAKFPLQDFVRFEPPAGLKPAELQAAWQGDVDVVGFTATLLDLSVRGIVRLGLCDEHLEVSAQDLTKPMTDWESSLVEVVLNQAQVVVLDRYREDVETEVRRTSSKLVESAIGKKFRNAQASRQRHPFMVLAGIFGVGLMASFAWGSSQFLSLAVGFLAFGLLGSLISIYLVPVEQTRQSADFLGQVEGFRKFLDTDAAEERREYVQRSGLNPADIFATMLPYAVIYELDQSWCAAFPDLTSAQLNTWGLAFVDPSHLGRSLQDASQAMADTMTAPSSSGSTAFGGFSGGGGGGGGGGSW